MAREHADQLLQRLEGTREWPPKWEQAWGTVRLWQAMREADGEYIKRVARWDAAQNRDRHYIVDPLAQKISGTFADLVFGEDPDITAATESDQDRLDALVEDNELPSELQSAEDICCSEGEVWWRLLVDFAQSDGPVIQWHSRLAVLPLLRGRKVVAAALVSTIQADDQHKSVFRYLEIHADEVVYNVLFHGAKDKLGTRVGLEARPETADLAPEWTHGLPMLCGRVINKRGRRPALGLSDFAGVKDYLLALNETATIGQENARMTLKNRAIIPDTYLDVRGQFPAGADVLIAPTTDQDPDRPQQGFAQLEWKFDAQAFIAYKNELERTILGRVGLAKQLVDAGNPSPDGRATGTALKLRLIPSILATAGKARFWDDQLPQIMVLLQQLDAMPLEAGGCGQSWSDPMTPPVFERAGALPEDETEEATRHSLLVTAEIESRQTAIEELHPDWSEDQVKTELDLIVAEARAATPQIAAGAPTVTLPGAGGDGNNPAP